MSEEDQYLSTTLYQKFPVRIDRGKGVRVWDTSGTEYIDCMGGYGVALVGHCNPRVVEAIKNQAEKLIVCHMSFYNDARGDFLSRMATIAPKGLSKIFFSNSGAEAVEAALKFSRRYTGKPGIISMSGDIMVKLSVPFRRRIAKSIENHSCLSWKMSSSFHIQQQELRML